jgi:branched-chain amino acid aminotransferase
METTKYIWMDGENVPWDEAQISVMTHALHYGTAVFEGIRCYDTDKGPMIFKLKEHVDRFFFSAETLSMEMPFSKAEITEAILNLIKDNKLSSCYIRPLAYYGYKRLGPPPTGVPTKVMIATIPYDPYLGDKSARVKISSYMRIHPNSSVMGAKISGHYANSALAVMEAHQAGFDESLLLDDKGNIAEAGAANFFIIKGDTLVTPTDRAILPGITRASLMQLAEEKMGMTVEERDISPDELSDCDEAFFCGTATEVAAIGEVDDLKIKNPDAPKALELKALYKRVVTGQEPDYLDWLTAVQ